MANQVILSSNLGCTDLYSCSSAYIVRVTSTQLVRFACGNAWNTWNMSMPWCISSGLNKKPTHDEVLELATKTPEKFRSPLQRRCVEQLQRGMVVSLKDALRFGFWILLWFKHLPQPRWSWMTLREESPCRGVVQVDHGNDGFCTVQDEWLAFLMGGGYRGDLVHRWAFCSVMKILLLYGGLLREVHQPEPQLIHASIQSLSLSLYILIWVSIFVFLSPSLSIVVWVSIYS